MYGSENERPEMSSWKPWLLETSQLKFRGIVDAIETDLKNGRLQPGERLPAQRTIAEVLNVDLTTVTRAFNEARRRGLVDANAGRGTHIRRRIGGRDIAGLDTPTAEVFCFFF